MSYIRGGASIYKRIVRRNKIFHYATTRRKGVMIIGRENTSLGKRAQEKGPCILHGESPENFFS